MIYCIGKISFKGSVYYRIQISQVSGNILNMTQLI